MYTSITYNLGPGVCEIGSENCPRYRVVSIDAEGSHLSLFFNNEETIDKMIEALKGLQIAESDYVRGVKLILTAEEYEALLVAVEITFDDARRFPEDIIKEEVVESLWKKFHPIRG